MNNKIKNGILENGILVNGRCQGNLNMNNYKIINLGYPSEDNHVVSREYISDVNGRIHLHGMVNNAKKFTSNAMEISFDKIKIAAIHVLSNSSYRSGLSDTIVIKSQKIGAWDPSYNRYNIVHRGRTSLITIRLNETFNNLHNKSG